MKRLIALVAGCGLAGLALAAASKSPTVEPPDSSHATPGRFVAHEWGTFTGFAGSDGVHLPFETTVGSDLPGFVINRQRQATRSGVEMSLTFQLSKGGGIAALQRMETPVIYFYSDQPREVAVKVDFPKGLLTEFYPPVRAMMPPWGHGPREFGTNGTRADGGSLDWGTVQIIPQPPGQQPTTVPPVPADAGAALHYVYARETDSAIVRYSDRPGEVHDEKFLFYRGLGNFTLPVKLTASAGGKFQLHNSGKQPILFALLLRNDAGRASFAVYRNVAGVREMTLPSETVDLSKVGEAITAGLIAEGLYEKEARSMVKTWSSSWLAEEGTRVLYTVPSAVTDELLPLRMSPMPDEVVRVLVGRIDVMTPEQEARIGNMLAASQKVEKLPADDAKFLHHFGRFRRPAIERIAAQRGGGALEEVRMLEAQYGATMRELQSK